MHCINIEKCSAFLLMLNQNGSTYEYVIFNISLFHLDHFIHDCTKALIYLVYTKPTHPRPV